MLSEYLVIACGIATNLAAVVICLSDRAKPLSPRKLWRAICKDQGIDPLRLRMALNPPALPHGGGARDPVHLPAAKTRADTDALVKGFARDMEEAMGTRQLTAIELRFREGEFHAADVRFS